MTRKHYIECIKETKIPTIPTETIIPKGSRWKIFSNREKHVTLYEINNPNKKREIRISKFRRNFRHRVEELKK